MEKKKTDTSIELLKKDLDNLNKRIDDQNSFFNNHLKITTVILAIAALILSYLSLSSRNDVNEAIKEMEKKFDQLSKQALATPSIELFYESKTLDGKIIEINIDKNNTFELTGIIIKNMGDGITKFLSMKFFLSENITKIKTQYWDWDIEVNYDKNYKSFFSNGGQIPVSPGEVWNLPILKGKLEKDANKDIKCRLEIYFGVQNPKVSHFVLKLVTEQ